MQQVTGRFDKRTMSDAKKKKKRANKTERQKEHKGERKETEFGGVGEGTRGGLYTICAMEVVFRRLDYSSSSSSSPLALFFPWVQMSEV